MKIHPVFLMWFTLFMYVEIACWGFILAPDIITGKVPISEITPLFFAVPLASAFGAIIMLWISGKVNDEINK